MAKKGKSRKCKCKCRCVKGKPSSYEKLEHSIYNVITKGS